MLSALLLMATAQSPVINLYRGASLGNPRYWDVEDTYLDSATPDSNFGGSYTLLAGKGKTILIRFGDLNRVVGPHKHVVSATLYLTPSAGDPPVLKSVYRLLQSWGEGPRTVLGNLIAPPPKTGVKPPPLHWAATFKARKSGIAAWQSPGAMGSDDAVPVKSAHLESKGKEFAIEGLEDSVQTMLDHPSENHGFSLEFTSSTEFVSSKSPSGTPRLEITTEDIAAPPGPDLSVIAIGSDPASPKNGQEVTYTATVKNVGQLPSAGFTAQWFIYEKGSPTVDKKDTLAPGATETLSVQRRYEEFPGDHRASTVALRIDPTGPDAVSTNNQLSIFTDGLPVNISTTSEAVTKLGGLNYLGSASYEDWVQAQVSLWNDTVAAQSFYSFAPEGVLQRIRVNSFSGGDPGVTTPSDASPNVASLSFLKSLSVAAGCLDGANFQITPGNIAIEGSTSRCSVDLFPGITGDGDTRFDGGILGATPIEYDSVYDPSMREMYLPDTDLLPATDVAGLNRGLLAKPVKPSDALLPIPKAIILNVADMQGIALPDVDLLFFQSSGGRIPHGNPVFAVKTNQRGIAILNTRGSAGPFGDLSPNGDNGVFLIQAKINGVLETGWLKAWQLSESNTRGAFTVDLRLNLPGAPVDKTINLCADKTLTDSAGDPPATLAPLIDGSEDSAIDLPEAKGAWVDIDLGRDRVVGEVDLVSNGKPFWSQFDIVIYGTGQKAQEGSLWARELNWQWTSKVRRDLGKSPSTSVIAYRASPQRVRFIRLVNKSGGTGNLSEIRIFPAKVAG